MDAKAKQRARNKANSERPEVKARRAEKLCCDNCGKCIARGYMLAHQKTRKCKRKYALNIWKTSGLSKDCI